MGVCLLFIKPQTRYLLFSLWGWRLSPLSPVYTSLLFTADVELIHIKRWLFCSLVSQSSTFWFLLIHHSWAGDSELVCGVLFLLQFKAWCASAMAGCCWWEVSVDTSTRYQCTRLSTMIWRIFKQKVGGKKRKEEFKKDTDSHYASY